MESSTFGHVTDWNEVIKKEARGQNDADLGEVIEVKTMNAFSAVIIIDLINIAGAHKE